MKWTFVIVFVLAILALGVVYYSQRTGFFETVTYQVDIRNTCTDKLTSLAMPEYRTEIIRKSAENKYLEDARKAARCVRKIK